MANIRQRIKEKLGIRPISKIPISEIDKPAEDKIQFIFSFEYLENGEVKRTKEFTIEEYTEEAAWRIALEQAKAECEEGVTVQYIRKTKSKKQK